MDECTVVRACSTCGVTKPLVDFPKASWCAEGRRGQCKSCRNQNGHRPTTLTKVCSGCDQEKPVGEFQRRSSSPDGLHQRCKACKSAYAKAYYPRDRERVVAYLRLRYDENREQHIAAVLAWQAANPERRREYEGRRRARKSGSGSGAVDVAALWGGVCGICGCEIDETLKAPHPLSKSLDHIIPLSLGGSHEQSNLQWSHLRCNIRKGARPTT